MTLQTLTFRALSLVRPETAHGLVCEALARGYAKPKPVVQPKQSTWLFGRHLRNPVGLPAGFVKYPTPQLLLALHRWGIGFVTVGSVTPVARNGNRGERHWRLPGHMAINWYGLNGPGIHGVVNQLKALRALPEGKELVLGASLANPPPEPDSGQSSFGDEVLTDMARFLVPYVDYFELNFSCPNTPEKVSSELDRLDAQVQAVTAGAFGKPVLVKLGPHFGNDVELVAVGETALAAGAAGFIPCNTLTHAEAQAHPELFQPLAVPQWRRHALVNGQGQWVGGLSGPPLLGVAQRMLTVLSHAFPKAMLIGCGGIQSRVGLETHRLAGAKAFQVYTGFAAHGPALLQDLVAARPVSAQAYAA